MGVVAREVGPDQVILEAANFLIRRPNRRKCITHHCSKLINREDWHLPVLLEHDVQDIVAAAPGNLPR
jgi:hypothetical protein